MRLNTGTPKNINFTFGIYGISMFEVSQYFVPHFTDTQSLARDTP